MSTGIYSITSADGRVYIGSALLMARRLNEHRLLLEKGKSHNARLQAAWNQAGAAAFTFRPLLICSREMLLAFEQRAIDAFNAADPASGFNLSRVAGSPLGVKWSVEAKARKSAQMIGNTPWNKGKKMSDEARLNMSRARTGVKLSDAHKAKLKGRKVWCEGKKWKRKPGSICYQTLKTHCPRGHPYSGANLYVHPKDGRRGCKKCIARSSVKLRRKQ